jgi:hypothetical protein
MQQAMVIANFTTKVGRAIRVFSGEEVPSAPDVPSKDDARDIREFMRPFARGPT